MHHSILIQLPLSCSRGMSLGVLDDNRRRSVLAGAGAIHVTRRTARELFDA